MSDDITGSSYVRHLVCSTQKVEKSLILYRPKSYSIRFRSFPFSRPRTIFYRLMHFMNWLQPK